MISSLKDLELGDAGSDYVEGRLRMGNSLALAIHARFKPIGKRCTTHLAKGTSLEACYRFDDGGVTSSTASLSWLVDIVRNYLSEGSDRVVVLEDALSRKGDAVLGRLQARVRYFNNEVYRVLRPRDNSDYAIRTTISEASAPHQLVGVFTKEPPSADQAFDEISNEELEWWSNAASSVVVQAYDGEGYLVCTV